MPIRNRMYRKMADIFALVQPQSPIHTLYSAGDEIEIYTQQERLEEHGWIEPISGTRARVTRDGAAIINHFKQKLEENQLQDELSLGAGRFVDNALETSDGEQWEVQTITDRYVVVRSSLGDRRQYRVPV